MGLDNGLYVTSDKRMITREMLPEGIVFPFDNDYGDRVEIAYWRKCWGLRDAILRRFGDLPNEYITDIDTPEKVMELIEEIASWLDEEKWEDEGRSIWSYDEIRRSLVQNIVNLSIIYTVMLGNPDVYLQFYDSY